MTELVNYSFVRANANPLPDPPWKVGSHAPGAQVLSNQCRNADTTYYALALSYYDGGVTWPADQWAQIVMSAADGGGDHYIGPVVHYNDTNNSFYAVDATQGQLELQRVSGGGFTVVASPAGNFVVSDVIRLESQTVGGSKFLKLFINDVQVLSYEDTSPLADGVAGIWFYSPSAAASSFQAGDFGAGSSDPTITDVDTDEIVLDGQTGVAVTGTDLGTTNADRTFTLRQGSVSVPQTETGTGTSTAATLTIGIEQSGADIKFGAATLRVTRTSDSAFGDLAVTVNPPTGQIYVDIGTPNATSADRITAVADIASGDQIHARGVGGGAVPTGLNLEADGTFWFDDGETPAAFDVRVWDASDSTWGAWATQGMAGTGVTIDAGFDSLAITEPAASVKLSRAVAAGFDTLAITERAATVKLSRAVAAGLDTLTISEQQAVVRLARHISASVDTLTLTEPAAQVHTGTGIAAGLDALTLAEHAAQVSAGTGISAGFDTLTLTELQASIAQGTGIAAGFDALSLAEQVATLRLAKAIAAGVDALVVTERQAAVSSGLQLSAGIDELLITERAALVNREREITAGFATLAITGRQALIGLARDIAAGVDSLLLTEQAAVVAIGRAILAGFDSLTIVEQQAIVQGQSAVIEVVAQRIVRVAARNSVVRVSARRGITVH